MPISPDPRPDLKFDSKEWTRLLEMAEEKNVELAWILNGFRCCGLRLHRDSMGYVLRPEFDPKSSQWASQREYEKDRDKWLMPYKQEIIELLDELGIIQKNGGLHHG